MYLLNTGWIILFADDPQMVYDFNLIALKLAEKVNLPVVVAFDGFFTSHQKQKCMVFSEDETVQHFIGKKLSCDNPEISAFAGNDSTGENRFYSVLDLNHPVSVGSYMNEPDIINNKYQLFLAMEETRKNFPCCLMSSPPSPEECILFAADICVKMQILSFFCSVPLFTPPQLQQIRCAKRASALALSH